MIGRRDGNDRETVPRGFDEFLPKSQQVIERTMARGFSGVSVPRKATDKYSTVVPTLNTAAPTMTP